MLYVDLGINNFTRLVDLHSKYIHIHHLSLLHSQSGLYNRLRCIVTSSISPSAVTDNHSTAETKRPPIETPFMSNKSNQTNQISLLAQPMLLFLLPPFLPLRAHRQKLQLPRLDGIQQSHLIFQRSIHHRYPLDPFHPFFQHVQFRLRVLFVAFPTGSE